MFEARPLGAIGGSVNSMMRGILQHFWGNAPDHHRIVTKAGKRLWLRAKIDHSCSTQREVAVLMDDKSAC